MGWEEYAVENGFLNDFTPGPGPGITLVEALRLPISVLCAFYQQTGLLQAFYNQ